MSLFGSIVDKIASFAEGAVGMGHSKAPEASEPPAAAKEEAPATAVGGGGAPAPAEAAAGGGAGAPAPLASVDIGAVLAARAASKGETLHWQSSIVDLLKVLDLDSSLAARKALAQELDVHAGEDGSAEENVALHRAVVAKLEANGGNVPAEMKN